MASFVPLKDVSIQDMAVILSNLNFSALVDPFLTNGVNGRAISRIKSHQSIVDIGNGRICEFVAETFYEDFVVEWRLTGVPQDLLLPKVCFDIL
jgi:hypothetical protein